MRLGGDDPLDLRPRDVTPDADVFDRVVDEMRESLAAVDVTELEPETRRFVETMRAAIARYDGDEDDVGGDE